MNTNKIKLEDLTLAELLKEAKRLENLNVFLENQLNNAIAKIKRRR